MKRVFKEILVKFFEHQLTNHDLLSLIHYERAIHSKIRYSCNNKVLFTESQKHTASAIMPIIEITECNIELFCSNIFSLVETLINQQVAQMFSSINSITELTGNSLNANNQKLTYKLILDMLDKIEFSFTSEGNPIIPTLIMPPKLHEQLSTIKISKQEEERFKEIVTKKEEEFNAKKRNRRLSYVNF